MSICPVCWETYYEENFDDDRNVEEAKFIQIKLPSCGHSLCLNCFKSSKVTKCPGCNSSINREEYCEPTNDLQILLLREVDSLNQKLEELNLQNSDLQEDADNCIRKNIMENIRKTARKKICCENAEEIRIEGKKVHKFLSNKPIVAECELLIPDQSCNNCKKLFGTGKKDLSALNCGCHLCVKCYLAKGCSHKNSKLIDHPEKTYPTPICSVCESPISLQNLPFRNPCDCIICADCVNDYKYCPKFLPEQKNALSTYPKFHSSAFKALLSGNFEETLAEEERKNMNEEEFKGSVYKQHPAFDYYPNCSKDKVKSCRNEFCFPSYIRLSKVLYPINDDDRRVFKTKRLGNEYAMEFETSEKIAVFGFFVCGRVDEDEARVSIECRTRENIRIMQEDCKISMPESLVVLDRPCVSTKFYVSIRFPENLRLFSRKAAFGHSFVKENIRFTFSDPQNKHQQFYGPISGIFYYTQSF
jgi:hypothetical protein